MGSWLFHNHNGIIAALIPENDLNCIHIPQRGGDACGGLDRLIAKYRCRRCCRRCLNMIRCGSQLHAYISFNERAGWLPLPQLNFPS